MQANIKFVNKDQSMFFPTLRKRVDEYFKEKGASKFGDYRLYIKTFTLISMYLVPYFLILFGNLPLWAMWVMTIIMGIGFAGIGMSVMHDANHASYSSNATVNSIIGYIVNLIGGNKYNWKIQHNVMHHTYTNIYGHDEDVENGNLFRLSPHAKSKKMHRYQHIYAWFLYSLGTFFWVTLKDYVQRAKIMKANKKLGPSDNYAKELFILILFKVIYYAYIIVIPLMILDITWWQYLIGFMTLHMVGGFILSVTFQLAHVVEETDHPLPTDEGNIENAWAIHQLETTANFARKSSLLNWYLGGLNFQIEHHLFPNISHVHYRKISEIVKSVAESFGLQYRESPTYLRAVASHYRVLKRLRK